MASFKRKFIEKYIFSEIEDRYSDKLEKELLEAIEKDDSPLIDVLKELIKWFDENPDWYEAEEIFSKAKELLSSIKKV